MKIRDRERLNFLEFLGRMSVLQFHALFAYLWDETLNQPKKWKLWDGVRGYPGQSEVLEAFSEEKYNWLLKGRQLGGDESVAWVCFYKSVCTKMHETDFITKDFEDAKYFLKRRLLLQIRAAYGFEYAPGRKLPWPEFVDNSDTGKIKWDNGSFVEAFISDDQGVRSRSPRLVVLNEIRTFKNNQATELWEAIKPAVDGHPSRRFIGLSTSAFGSWFNVTTKAIMDGKMSGIRFLFMPDDTNPDRTPAWRKEVMSRSLDPAMFLQEHPLEPDDCFVGREGAVIKKFDSTPGGRHVNHVNLDFSLQFCIVYDHGKRHPAVLLLCLYDKYSDHLYVFDEVFCRELDLPEVAFEIRKKMTFYKRNHGAPEPQLKIADAAIFSETGQQTVASALRDLTGINFRPSHKYDIKSSMDRLIARFGMGKITLDPRCEQSIKQLKELRYKKPIGEPGKDEIIALEDDAPACLRYLDAEINPSMRRKPDVVPLEVVLNRRAKAKEMAGRGVRKGADAVPELDKASWLNL